MVELSNGHLCAICQTHALLAQIQQGESHLLQKWHFANVSKSDEPTLAKLAFTRIPIFITKFDSRKHLFLTYLPNLTCAGTCKRASIHYLFTTCLRLFIGFSLYYIILCKFVLHMGVYIPRLLHCNHIGKHISHVARHKTR